MPGAHTTERGRSRLRSRCCLCPRALHSVFAKVGMTWLVVRGLLLSVLPPSHPTNFSQSQMPPVPLLPRNPVVPTHQPVIHTSQATSSASSSTIGLLLHPSQTGCSAGLATNPPSAMPCVDSLGHFLPLQWPLCLLKSYPTFPQIQLKSLTTPAPSLQWIPAPSFISSFDSHILICMANHVTPRVS